MTTATVPGTGHDWCRGCQPTHGGTTDPAHAGEMVKLAVPPHMEPSEDDPAHLLKVQLWATDRNHTDPRAYLDFDDEDGEVSMDADQLGEFIGQLDTFREALVAMRAQLDAKQVTV